MAVEIQEVVEALGEWGVDFKKDSEIISELKNYTHLMFFWGADNFYTGPILGRVPGSPYRIKGRGLEWWQGMELSGPLVKFREYLSGKNKLSNPGFENQELYWDIDDDSEWSFRSVGGEPDTGSWCAVHLGDYEKDDKLKSAEVFKARPGNQFQIKARVKRSGGTIGHLRLRGVCGGNYTTPNLFSNGDFESGAITTPSASITRQNDPAHAFSGNYVLKVGPIPQPQIVLNPSFESGLANWTITAGAGWGTVVGGVDGSFCLSCIDLTGGTDAILNDATPTTFPGDKWRVEASAGAAVGTDGNFDVRYFVDGSAPLSLISGDGASLGGNWKSNRQDVEVQSSGNIIVSVNVWGMTGGQYLFDRLLATKISGNIEESVLFTVSNLIPEGQYNMLYKVKSDAHVGGSAWVRIRYKGAGRTDIVQDMQPEQDTNGEWNEVAVQVQPPSGYDSAVISVIGKDVIGGSFWFDKFLLFNQNTSEAIFDFVSGASAGSWTTLTGTVTCPASTTSFHAEVVAESLGDGWKVDNVSVIRVDAAPKSFATIIQELLKHPDTGAQITQPGTIVGTDLPQWDWEINNLPNRECIQHACRSGLFLPLREYRFNPDNTLDSDVPANLYEDRDGFVLLHTDFRVKQRPSLEESVEADITDLTILGAERPMLDGTSRTVTGVAERPPDPDAVDHEGNPVQRGRVDENSDLDHDDYADAYAEASIDATNEDSQTISVSLTDWRMLGKFNLGDTIRLHDPENDVVDLSNTMEWRGRTIHPWIDRVLSRKWTLSEGSFRIKLLKYDGTIVDVSDHVMWSPETAAELELGSLPADFVVDPQGGAAGNQFLRYRSGH